MAKLFIPSLLFVCNYMLNLGFLGIHENDGPQWLASLAGLVPQILSSSSLFDDHGNYFLHHQIQLKWTSFKPNISNSPFCVSHAVCTFIYHVLLSN